MLNKVIILSLSLLLLVAPEAVSKKKAKPKEPAPSAVKKKKKPRNSNGTHMFIVITPDEYYKDLSKMALAVGLKLSSKNAILAMPYNESLTKPPKTEYTPIYKKKYKKGVKMFKKGKYSKAVKLLKDAVDGLSQFREKYGPSYKVKRRLALSYLYLGAAQLMDALTDDAKGSFRLGFSVFPGYPLPKSAFKVAATLEVFNKSIEPPGFGSGTVIANSDVKGFVYLDGNLVGVTPAIIENVPPGRHAVTFARYGYKPLFQEVTVKDQEKAVTEFKVAKSDNFKEISSQINTIDSQLLNKDGVPPELATMAKKMRVDNIVIFRANANDTEISWYNAKLNAWHKRVRRRNVVPGNLNKTVVNELFKIKPVIDLAKVSENDKKCYADRDCGEGSCVGGRCVLETPIYKKWWFWTAIGAGVAAAGGGTYMILKLKNRPEFEVTTP
ncbi:MAG: PEGA domain-containing protein [Deltaproteobacteria bacterium]|nr:PEGA domain-containing protein [Deltaproteobacteria bacterium]